METSCSNHIKTVFASYFHVFMYCCQISLIIFLFGNVVFSLNTARSLNLFNFYISVAHLLHMLQSLLISHLIMQLLIQNTCWEASFEKIQLSLEQNEIQSQKLNYYCVSVVAIISRVFHYIASVEVLNESQ